MCTTCDDLNEKLQKAVRHGDRRMADALHKTLDAHLLMHEQEAATCKPADGLVAQLWPGAKVSRGR